MIGYNTFIHIPFLTGIDLKREIHPNRKKGSILNMWILLRIQQERTTEVYLTVDDHYMLHTEQHDNVKVGFKQ